MLNIKNSGILCEGCRAASSSVNCRENFSYLCITCDSRTHNTTIRHDRVVLCASCASSPAVFLCKADSASLCAACDAKIHSANPLAGRHHRVPIQPMNGIPSPSADTFAGSNIQNEDDDDEEEAASWLLINPINSKANHNGGLRYSGFQQLADFSSSTNLDEQRNQEQDYNVPQRQFFQLGFEYEDPKAVDFFSASSFYGTPGVVPDTTTTTQVSFTQQFTEASSDTFPSCAIDREARVLRYREKKKNRKFEKTIRYASRKAYAEVRPRIKGRFVKQEVQVCCNTMVGIE